MKVIAIKLVSGEEVIANYESEDEVDIIVTDPKVIHLMPGPGGQVNVTMPPYMLSAQEHSEVRIAKSTVSGMHNSLASNFEAMYMQMISKLDLTTKIQT